MVSQNVNNLLKQVGSLSLEEREQFLGMLRTQPAREQPGSTEDERWAQELQKRGVVITIPPKPTPESIARFKAWRPIEMPGPSLSDELIRDRR